MTGLEKDIEALCGAPLPDNVRKALAKITPDKWHKIMTLGNWDAYNDKEGDNDIPEKA